MHKQLIILSFLVSLLVSSHVNAQVTLTTRHVDSYSKDVFDYAGVRLMTVDEASVKDSVTSSVTRLEDNVFIFSKPEQNTKPDTLYFQQYKKTAGKWTLAVRHAVTHDGFISVWKSRKAFLDADKDQSVDAYFAYSKHDSAKEQISTHLLICHKAVVYTISATKASKYKTMTTSDNFNNLNADVKAAALDYWNRLDKD